MRSHFQFANKATRGVSGGIIPALRCWFSGAYTAENPSLSKLISRLQTQESVTTWAIGWWQFRATRSWSRRPGRTATRLGSTATRIATVPRTLARSTSLSAMGRIGPSKAYLKASNTEAGDNFGATVAVSGDTTSLGLIQRNHQRYRAEHIYSFGHRDEPRSVLSLGSSVIIRNQQQG